MTTTAAAATADRTYDLPLERVDPPADNVRSTVGNVTELAASIKSVGVLEPLLVTERRDGAGEVRYLIVCGSRRHAAAKAAGLTHVPAVVRELTETERLEAMAIENLQREDLTPLEEARAYQRLIDTGLSQRMVATRIGRSQGHISKRVALLALPTAAQKQIDAGGITMEDAAHLAKLAEHPERIKQVLREHDPWRPIDRLVAGHLAKLADEAKAARTKEELARSGAHVVELKRDRYDREETPKGYALVREHAWGDGQVEMAPAKHAKLECRAVAVDRRGSVIELCRDPARHAGKVKKPSAAEERKRHHTRELDRSRKGRRAFAATVATGKGVGRTVAFAIAVEGLIQTADQGQKKIACELLQLEPTAGQYGGHDYDTVLREHATTDRGQNQVAIAIAFAAAEIRTCNAWSSWGPVEHGYLERLQAYGYQPTEAERLELDGKAPPRA